MPKRVLVTGGAGFLGTHLVRRLVELGVDVAVLDDLSSGHREAMPPAVRQGHLTVGDVRDVSVLRAAMQAQEAVIHLADRPVPSDAPSEGCSVNVLGTLAVLHAAKEAHVPRVVHASSCSVYGGSGAPPFLESRPLGPVSLVGASKAGAEMVVRAFAEQGAFQAVALRFFHVYGRGRVSSAVPGVLATFGKEVAAGRPPAVHGSGENTRDFLHVDDAVEAIRLSLERRVGAWTAVNVGSGVATTIRNAAEAVCTALGRIDLEPVSVDAPPGPTVNSFADTRYARSTLGFEPKIPFTKGLERRDFHLPFEPASA